MKNQSGKQLESLETFEALHAAELDLIKGGTEAPVKDSNKNDSQHDDSKKHDKFN